MKQATQENQEKLPTKKEYIEALIEQVNYSVKCETESLAAAFKSKQEMILNQCFSKSASMDQYADCCIQRKKNLEELSDITKLTMDFFIFQLPGCLSRNQKEICRRSLVLRIKENVSKTKTDLQGI